MKESKAMMKKEVAFMKKKGAPKSMIKHEEKEMKAYKKGGGVGRSGPQAPIRPPVTRSPQASPQASPTPLPGAGRLLRARSGGMMKGYKEGGAVYRKGADGVAHKGKTKGKVVKMAYGGKC